MPIFPLQDSCPVGYTFNLERLKCEDVNECQTNEHDCLESQRCDNTLGSFTCVRYVTCGTGYTLNYNTGEFGAHCVEKLRESNYSKAVARTTTSAPPGPTTATDWGRDISV